MGGGFPVGRRQGRHVERAGAKGKRRLEDCESALATRLESWQILVAHCVALFFFLFFFFFLLSGPPVRYNDG